MSKHFIFRSIGAMMLTAMGIAGFAQDEENDAGERRVRIEITKKENGSTSHTTREFNLNDADQLKDALKDLGVMDELNDIGRGENLSIDIRRMVDGGMLNAMSLALTVPGEGEDMEPRAFLGVDYEDYTAECDKKNKNRAPVKEGACITGVEEGTAAEKAGLKDGDVIVRFDETNIANGDDLVEAIGDHKPGDTAKVTYYRGKQKSTVEAVLGKHQEEDRTWNWNDGTPGSEDMDWEAYNSDGNWNSDGRAFLGVYGDDEEGDRKGVQVTNVVEGSAAEKMGIKEGDVIVRISGLAVEDFEHLTEMISGKQPDDPVAVDVMREGKPVTLSGKLGKRQGRSFSFAYPPEQPLPPDAPSRPDEPMAPIPDMPGMPSQERDELRREMDNLRHEMSKLRRDLHGDVTREMRVTIKDVELNKEEKELLRNKGVTSLDQPLDLQELRCYPNPSADAFHITFAAPERGDLDLDVHDATGERVYHETITGFKGNYERTLDMSDKPSGTYYLVITQSGRATAQKLVKK